MSSTRVPTSTEMEATMAARAHQAHIFQNTRRVMRICTGNMFAISLRDHQRQKHVTTKCTTPAVLKRRYSIDVNTRIRGSQVSSIPSGPKKWRLPAASHMPTIDFADDMQSPCNAFIPSPPSCKRKHDDFEHDELECVDSSTNIAFPDPLRYYDFHKWTVWYPPFDHGIYFELNTATIHNDSWYWMTSTEGYERYMLDDGLDMALTVLSCATRCDDSKIGIASSVDSQICLLEGDTGKERYAECFGDKRWIFMPQNDGMGEKVNTGGNGNHWSLVALDRIHRVVHYFDSAFVFRPNYQEQAWDLARGMLRILGEDIADYEKQAEYNSPNQWENNLCQFDQAACAPFVYEMTRLAICEIQCRQRDGQELHCDLSLPIGFQEYFGSRWNSYETRCKMQGSIAFTKSNQAVQELTSSHDEMAIAGEDVEYLHDEPPFQSDVPQKPPGRYLTSHYFDTPRTPLPAGDDKIDCESVLSDAVTIGSDESVSSTRAVLDGERSSTQRGKISIMNEDCEHYVNVTAEVAEEAAEDLL